jgi:DNA-binding response OmpR family regulator
MMPNLDGFGLLAALQADPATTAGPVIRVSARAGEDGTIEGLEAGADDYLVKPFAFSELLARVRALSKRARHAPGETLSLADLTIDPLRRRVMRAGQRVDLTAKEYALLLLFLRRQTEVLSRTFIAEQVWDMNFDSDTNVVDVAVRRLRAKIDDPFPAKLIHAVRGVGYVCELR